MAMRAPVLFGGALLLLQASACGSNTTAPAGPVGSGGNAGSGGSLGSGGGSPGSGGAAPGTGGAASGTGGAADGGPGAPDVAAEVSSSDASAPDTGGSMLPAGIPAGYKLLLDEPFISAGSVSAILAGNPSDWSHGTEDGGYLQYGGAGYAPPNPPVPDSLTSFALVSAMKFGSFVLEVELASRNPSQTAIQRDMCIVFNIKSETEYYFAHIAQGHSERFHNIHKINNAPRQAITKTENGGIRWGSVNQWHKVRIVRDVVSGNIAVYFDSDLANPILTATDTTFTEGYVGFGTHEDPGRIRNLKVWGAAAVAQPAPATFFR